MLRINESVLRGGFDVVKDDELTPDTSLSPFSERVETMVSMIRRVQDAVGERKMYFANVIGEVRRSLSWARTAARAGVDGLLVSPMLQGLEIARVMAEETGLPVLAHNTLEDIILRHPRFGVSQPVYMTLQRIIGADLLMLPGAFSTGSMPATEERACIDACAGPIGKMRPVLPILAGGKTPDGLAGYLRSVGSPDFMLIAAAAVDHHPGGLEAGARAFREACESFA
jgi:ribulose 1,5-bisphosphate carboxylase large subunit-like protein